MRVSIALICIVFSSLVAGAQQRASITGKVTWNGSPQPGAVIELISRTGDRRTARSDQEGNFRIEDLSQGRYRLTASISQSPATAAGASNSSTIDLGKGEPRSVNIDLIANAIRETVTIAVGDSEPIEQVSKTVNVISGQEMRDRADFTLVDSLRTIPGFRVQQLGGFGRAASIKTRGLRNQDTAILIDGVRFRDPSAITGDASSFLSDLTLTSVSRVEVLRGSGSSLYGTNAIGGVVDLQTPTARSGTHGQISGAAGGLGLGRFRGNLSHGLESGRFGFTSGVSRTVYTKGIDGNDEAHNTNFQSRVDASPWSRTSISGRFFYSNADVKLNSGPDTIGLLPPTNKTIIEAIEGTTFRSDVDDPDNLQKSRAFTGQLVVNQVLTDKLTLGGYFQMLSTRRTNISGPLGVGFQSASESIFDGRSRTLNAHLTWEPSTGQTLKIGYEFEAESFGNEGSTPSGSGNFFTKARQRSNTLFAHNRLNLLNGDLQLAAGLRWQGFSLHRPTFSLTNAPYNNVVLDDPPSAMTFDGSVAYLFRAAGTKLRAHAGNGYRVPSLYERFGTFFSSFGTPSFIAIGDPLLKPEKTFAIDGGVEQSLDRWKTRVSATYFYTRLNDVIGYGNTVSPIGSTVRPFGGYLNQKGGIARGAEVSLRTQPSNSTDVFVSYTYTNSDHRAPQVSGSGVLSSLGIPDNQFTAVITQRFGRAWASLDLIASSTYLAPIFSNSTFSTYIYRFGGNRRADLTGGYNFRVGDDRALRVFGTIENMFDHQYFENGFRTIGITGRIGASFSF